MALFIIELLFFPSPALLLNFPIETPHFIHLIHFVHSIHALQLPSLPLSQLPGPHPNCPPPYPFSPQHRPSFFCCLLYWDLHLSLMLISYSLPQQLEDSEIPNIRSHLLLSWSLFQLSDGREERKDARASIAFSWLTV